MFDRGFPKRGLSMETVAALFGVLARGVRGLFDLASMAVGIAPNCVSLADAATVPDERTATAVRSLGGLTSHEDHEFSYLFREEVGMGDMGVISYTK